MFRNCKYCNKEFIIDINNGHISQKRKLFCCRYHKNMWNQKNNIKVILAKKRAQHKYYYKNKEIIISKHMSRYYTYHPKKLLSSIEKLQHRRIWDRNYKYRLRRLGTKLTLETVQKVYEDNIKCFGTLSCIYCLQPINFGNDSLEHIIPLSRGGTNDYNNLGVACFSCNNIKNNKLITEIGEI